MKTRAKFALIVMVILALATAGTVAAQEVLQTDAPQTCDGDVVSGTVVSVEPSESGGWTVLILEEAETTTDEPTFCTVTLSDEEMEDGEVTEGHPIVVLLANAFGDSFNVDGDALEEAANTPEVCLMAPETEGDPYTWADCEAESPPDLTGVKVLEYDPATGIITALVFDEEGNPMLVEVDISGETLPEELVGELESIDLPDVNWDLDGQGNVLQTDDKIAAYHEDGMGFGVLVKFLSMAAEAEQACAEQEEAPTEGVDPCTVTLQSLVDEFNGGKGIGEMFKEYGKPGQLGIGHVRNDKENKGQGPKQQMTDDETSVTTDGPGNKPDVPPGQQKKQDNDQSTDLQNDNPGKGKPKNTGKSNNGKGKGKP